MFCHCDRQTDIQRPLQAWTIDIYFLFCLHSQSAFECAWLSANNILCLLPRVSVITFTDMDAVHCGCMLACQVLVSLSECMQQIYLSGGCVVRWNAIGIGLQKNHSPARYLTRSFFIFISKLKKKYIYSESSIKLNER